MPSNSREALIHFRKTLRRHEAGETAGTRALAFCYLTGHGIDQSVERAVAILKTLKEDYYNGEDYLPLRLDKIQENLTFVDAIRSNFRMMDTLPLPLAGGWGYDEHGAIVIDLSLDDGYEEDRPFSLHRLERLLIENRVFLECVLRATERLSGVEWRVVSREVYDKGDKTFVKLAVDVHGCPEWVWNALERDWKMTRQRTPRSKAEAHTFIREWFLRRYTSEFWLDVTKVPKQFVEWADPRERQKRKEKAKEKNGRQGKNVGKR